MLDEAKLRIETNKVRTNLKASSHDAIYSNNL